GLGLPERYQGHFFLADFRGGSGAQSGIRSFANKPKGAGFEMVDAHEFIWGVLATDVDFGPDCAVYVSDWVAGWNKPNKGRIYRVAYSEAEKDDYVRNVKKLLAEEFGNYPTKDLALGLEEHKDMRVRQELQFELAKRGEEGIQAFSTILNRRKSQLGRIHAVWGLGQIGRSNSAAYKPVIEAAKADDAEVRAQALKVLGDGRVKEAPYVEALQDKESRVRFFAAQGLARVGTDGDALKAVTAMLRDNDDKDAFLRHTGVMALAACRDRDALLKAGDDPSAAVRMGV